MIHRRSPLIMSNLVTLVLMLVVFAGLAQPNRSVSANVPQSSLNCTFTQGYWKTHPEAWPVTSLSIGGVTYSQQQLLNILNSSISGDATYILAQQLIAAKLNIANGADNFTVAQTIASADAFLVAHPLGSTLSKNDRSTATSLANKLDRYNMGKIGPGACKPNTPTNTPTSTPTNTPANTATNTPTDTPTNTPVLPTNTPTDTPTSTLVTSTNTPTDTPTNTPVIPTNTPTDTPTSTPVTSTNTPTDTPTNTAVIPTNTPTDTPTSTPVTPTNTPTDTPTNTPVTPTNTPTDTPTSTPVTPTNTPTNTPTPV